MTRQSTPRARPLPRGTSICVCVPTYNEAENIEDFAAAVLEQFDRLAVKGVVLFIDDGSPDGTGRLADGLAESDSRVRVLHRTEKEGIGPAYKAGFAWAQEHAIDTVVEMDCDFSHDPEDLGRLLEGRETADVVLGSRYVPGGAVVDWPWWRRAISRGGSCYAGRVLGVSQRDLTGGFKCFGPGALARIPLDDVSAAGYGFQIETTWRALREDLRVSEVPITFRERTRGASKMSFGIAVEAALMVPRLRWSERSRRPLWPSRRPIRSWVSRFRPLLIALAVLIVLTVAVISSATVAHGLLALQFLLATGVGLSTLALMLYAWRDADGLAATAFPASDRPPRHSFSLIVPARHEEQVLAETLRQLRELEHPDFEVVVVVGDDDPGTKRVARRAVRGDERFRVVVDSASVKNKPRALNTALKYCNNDVVGVFDAEDLVAPGLLLAVDRRLQETGADIDVVQGAAQLMNFHSNWYSVRNVLEYYFWFKSRLHFHARMGYIPLGGNTVFIRRRWLTENGGWDGDCLAEDCELGARLSGLGARTAVAYSPELVTREETPASLRALLQQRTRWNQGFLQVFRKRQWTKLPAGARVLALYTLSFPILQAILGLSVPLALAVALLLKLPIVLALASFVPLAALAAILLAELVGLAQFGQEFSMRPRVRDYFRLVLGSIPYQLLLSVAAVRATWREMRGINNWEKTAHVGAHL